MRTSLLTAAAFLSSFGLLAQTNSGVEVEQSGSGNVVEISQQNLSPAFFPDVLPVLNLEQHGVGNLFFADRTTVESSEVNAGQWGVGNEMYLDVYDVYSETELIQIGQENKLWLTASTETSTVRVQQGLSMESPGLGNQAILQLSGMDNWINLTQLGQENFAALQQQNSANNAYLYQEGAFNEATSSQAGRSVSLRAVQGGVDNILMSSQAGEGVITTIEQAGQGNRAYLHMGGDMYVGATLEQSGNENLMNITQSVMGGDFEAYQRGSYNVLDAEQVGIGLEARIEQDGNENYANLQIYSDGSLFSARQLGNENFIDAHQSGSFSQAEILQQGNRLSATINQE